MSTVYRKVRYEQPKRTLPHVIDLATCDNLICQTEGDIEELIRGRIGYTTERYATFYREYHRLLRELRIRRAELER